MDTLAIEKRYGALAEESCCLSCGGAGDKGEAQHGEICVDLGCGRGTEALRLCEAVGKDGFVFGIDISDKMLQKANETAKKLGVNNVRFDKAELDNLRITSGSADLVVSNCVLNHATDKPAVWREIYRILKPGGRYVISDIFATAPVPEKWKQDPNAVAECWAGAETRDRYLSHIAQAGFSIPEVLDVSQPYSKGEIEVCSWTIKGIKIKAQRCCCG